MQNIHNLIHLSKQKRFELSSLLFDVIRDALLIFNHEGNIIEANQAACELYKYPYDQLIGLLGYDIISKKNHSLLDEFVYKVSNGNSFAAQSNDVKKMDQYSSLK